MSNRIRLVLLALLLGLAHPMRADEKAVSGFVLGADDVIEISVENHSDLDKTLTVLSDGTVTFPVVGELRAAGRTPKALAAEIRGSLEKTYNNVAVVISVKEVHSRRARVVGAVKSAGGFDLKPGWRLMDFIAMAGGLSTKPSLITGRLIRSGGKVVTLDVERAVAKPDSEANLELQPDDLVLLDELDAVRSQVNVLGQVARPGAYDFDANTNLLTLVAQAGNTTERAALKRAYVVRGTQQIPINLYPLFAESKPDEAVTRFQLQRGDVLFLPEITEQFAVMGQVARPGYYPVPEKKADLTVLLALSLAGGQTQTGDLNHAGIIRIVNGKPQALPVNIDAMMRKGGPAPTITLQAEDVLYIPEKRSPHSLFETLAPLNALSVLGLRLFR